MLASLAVGGVIVIVKVSAYFYSGSMAVMADMMESLVHNLAVLFATYSLWYSWQPPDEDHLYGHGKIQFFSSGVEGGLVCGAGVLILVNVIEGLIKDYKLMDVSRGIILVISAGIINSVLGWYLIRTGQKYNSIILKANGAHVLSDVVTTLASLTGMVGARLSGIIWVDAGVATLGAIYILINGLRLLRSSFSGLMDEADRDVDHVVKSVLDNESREHQWDYHELRHRSEGNRHWVELHLVLDRNQSLEEAHEQASHLEEEIRKAFNTPVHITTHLEPNIPEEKDE